VRLFRWISVFSVALCAVELVAQVTFGPLTNYAAPSGSSQATTISADLDHDGNPDLITIDDGLNAVLIRYGLGGGTFGAPEQIPVGIHPTDVQVGDFNGDGNLDISVANYTSSTITILLGSGRTFTPSTISTNSTPLALAVGYFSGSGHLDLAVSLDNSTQAGDYIQIYDGNGNGTFTPGNVISNFPCTQMIAADINKDGKTDIVCVNDVSEIFLNAGNGTFTMAQTLTPPASGGLYVYGSLADINGDAAPDLVLTDNGFCGPGCGYIYALDTYINDGTGHFTLKQSFQPVGTPTYGTFADLNYDGKTDLAFVDQNNNQQFLLGYYLGSGDGTFQAFKTTGAFFNSYAVSLLLHDVSNDGLADVIGTSPQVLQVELNTSATPDCSSPNSSKVAVHTCLPAAGSTLGTTFSVRAAANAPTSILRIEEWLDGKKVYQQLSNQVRNTLTTTPGTHTLTLIPVDIFGNYMKQNETITVTSSCSPPSSAGVRICSPASGSTVSSPVTFSAAARPSTGTSITAMRLYVDNVSKYTVNGNTLYTSVTLATGSHSIAVVGYEANGAALKTTQSITVH
jgi:hypothetical protein